MKRYLASTVIAVALLTVAFTTFTANTHGSTHPAKAAKDEAVTNKKCPITGKDTVAKYRTEYEGQYVYFCCPNCPAEFKKDPASYVARMSAEDQAAIKINDKCPLTGEAIDKSVWAESEGRKVYFCCPTCIPPYKKKHTVTASSDDKGK